MSARAWKRRRAKALLRDPAVRRWFQDCCDQIEEELARAAWPRLPWRLTMHGLPAGAPKTYGESPGASALRDAAELGRTAHTYMGVPVVVDQNCIDRDFPVFVDWGPMRTYTETETTEAVIDDEANAEEEARLLGRRAALRWERVARRWEAKHRPVTLQDFARQWQAVSDACVRLTMERLDRAHGGPTTAPSTEKTEPTSGLEPETC